MFRPKPITALLLVSLIFPFGQRVDGRDFRPSPPFAGSILLEPPQQKAAWTAPAVDLPTTLTTAVATLLRDGMADPRGCEYRALELSVGNCWSGDSGVISTHGWALPAKDGDKQRFAVCWNGLVYPVVSVGAAADLKADVLAVVKADEAMRTAYAKDSPNSSFYRFRKAWPEDESVSYKSLLPVKICLLLRLGEGELARQVWEAWTAGMKPNTNDDAVHLKDPYLMLATDWVWAMFDRAVCAHMRGDDHLALADARALVSMEKAVAAEAEKRGFKPRQEPTIGAKKNEHPYLEFLDSLPGLLADQERRAKEPKRQPVPPPGKDKAKRIAALIGELEDTAARQDGQPGGVNLGGDPTVTALIEEGDAAVEPLLKCLEDDARLTRSVHFWRDFATYRSLLGVHEAAYVALSGILQTSFFGDASTGDDLSGRGMEGRRATAAAVRAYWNKFKGVRLEERWYMVLADDKASSQEWLQAAGNIVQPVDVSVSPSSMFGAGWVTVPNRAASEKPKLRGEGLRAKKGPSVAELMGKRIDAVREMGEPGSRKMWALEEACTLAKDLFHWDEKAGLPYLRRMVQTCRDYLAGSDPGYPRTAAVDPLGREIAQLTSLRVQARDAALDEYAPWVATVPLGAESFSFKDILQPMWENPTHPAVAAAAESMFGKENSPWIPKFLRGYNTHDLLETPMIGVAAFRNRVLVELTNKEKAGTITLYENGVAYTELDGGMSSSGGDLRPKDDPLAPKPRTPRTFRVCDYFAFQLSLHDGLPACRLYWPLEKRDLAVAECAKLLRQYGERFENSPLQDSLWTLNDRARMTFPPLDHPATAEDVKKGLAIFTLESEGKTRLVNLTAPPMKARWATLKETPFSVQRVDPKTKKVETVIDYDQDGLVWQAEEVLKDGKWERYYGFVGANRIARVPSAEIEFPPAEPRPRSPSP